MAASVIRQSFKHLRVISPSEFVLHVELNRPERLNALNPLLWEEIGQCFSAIKSDPDVRAVIFSGAGKHFCSGLDLADPPEALSSDVSDVGRKAFALHHIIALWQGCLSAIEKCDKPVIAALHGGCIGGGVDAVTACDIRLASKDAFFSVKEVDIGMAADVGTLQRLPKVVGNQSWVRDICLTARRFYAPEAKEYGLLSGVFESREALMEAALKMAQEIAEKSPVAVRGTKHLLNYSRDHTVDEGLQYTVVWNGSMLQSEDFITATMAGLTKQKPTFSKL
ncbi:ClpP/crotonase [Ramicandelaber brevisporus]|nr:ClpP/crotonase [Ramicandelaber brevisporus]